jgi:hypothetical protein
LTSKNKTFVLGVFFILSVFVLYSNAFRRQREYCSLLNKCNLKPPVKDCPDSLSNGVEDIVYDETRCFEARQLVEKGISPTYYQGQKLFGFLGQKFRVAYNISDSLPVKQKQFEFLLDDIPLAAKVVNAFQETEYTAMYLDGDQKKYWRGNNGSNLNGEAALIAGSIQERHLIYFGFGIVKILKWKLKGQVLFDYNYVVNASGKINYELKVLVFPGGAIVNAIMNLSLFKKIVKKKIIEVFSDIINSANALNKLSFDELLKKYKWTEDDKSKLKILLSLKNAPIAPASTASEKLPLPPPIK